MKRILLLTFMAISLITTVLAERIGTMKIRGVDCQYDTLIYRHIGPGATYTQLQFTNMKIGDPIPYKMRMHLIEIDMTNSYNRMSPYLAEGRYYDYASQSDDVKRQKKLGLKPFASVNGINFIQSRPEPGEPYSYMETQYNLMGNDQIWYEDDVNRVRFYTDASKTGHVEALTMKAVVTSASGTSAEIGQINHYRDLVRDKNKLALFCNGMDKAKDNRPDDGLEVFLQGEDIKAGINQLKVVRKKNGCGDPIENGQCVITGVGREIETYLNSLEIGEAVTIKVDYIDANGNAVVPTDTYTAYNPNCVKNGVPYGDPRKEVAYSATGVSRDGKTVYLADMEISLFSDAPLRCLEDFLIEVGAWNACYNDGGPSAEMTIDGKFVTNNSNSLSTNFHRYIANGIMVYSTAPDDTQIVKVECDDPSLKKLKIGESFDLNIFGYNKYGEMVDEKAYRNYDVEIKCSSEIGTISMTRGTFTATKEGVCIISIGVKDHGIQVTIPVNVGNQSGLILSPEHIFTGEGRKVQLNAKYFSGSNISSIDPALVSWSVDDPYIVSSCNNGLVEPYMDGYATITASYMGVSASASVEVENLEEVGATIVDLSDKTGPVNDIDLLLPSVPHSFFIETIPADDDPIIVTYVAGNKEVEKKLENKGVGIINGQTVFLDYDEADGYPVKLKSIRPSSVEIKSLLAVYSETPLGIAELHADKVSRFEISRTAETLTLANCSSATDATISVYSFNGIKFAEKQVYLSEAESCTLDVRTAEPVIVRVQTKNGVQVFKLVGE